MTGKYWSDIEDTKPGKMCTVGEGTVIPNNAKIGEGSKIGKNCIFDCERLIIGKIARIGDNCKITCRDVEIGDLLFAGDNIKIGAGGEKGPRSKLRMGDDCYIGDDVIINTTKEVTIGNNVCIGIRAQLFTHGHWLPSIDGYWNAQKPITIEDNVWVGNNAFVLPGTIIRTGSVVTVNSVVSANIPPHSLVTGNPGRIIQRDYPAPLTEEDRHNWINTLIGDVIEHLNYIGRMAKRKGHIIYIGKRTIVFSIEKIKVMTTVFDLNKKTIIGPQDSLTDEIREILRKRGIKFEPYLWRHKWKI